MLKLTGAGCVGNSCGRAYLRNLFAEEKLLPEKFPSRKTAYEISCQCLIELETKHHEYEIE
jgi:hypothetical protein